MEQLYNFLSFLCEFTLPKFLSSHSYLDQNGLTALHLCAQEDFIRVASILVKNGANVESQTETGYRPIHVAAHFGNLSMIRFLLKHNAEIDVRTNQNYTSLHQAAQQGHAHIVSALLEGNASHKARTNVRYVTDIRGYVTMFIIIFINALI